MKSKNNRTMTPMIFTITFTLFILMISPGCIQGLNQFSAQYKYGTANSMGGLTDYQGAGSCNCIICTTHERKLTFMEKFPHITKYSKSTYVSLFPSLKDEKCKQIKCNQTEFMDELRKSNQEIMQEGIGIGTTAYDFNKADVWCANRMRYAVEWATTMNYKGYPTTIDPEVNTCFLKNNVVPIILLYSSGTYAGIGNIHKYINDLKNIGPLIIGTEVDPKLSDRDKVKQEINTLSGPISRNYQIGLSLPSDNMTKAAKFADDILGKASLKSNIDYMLIGVRVSADKPIGTAFNQVFALSRYIMYKYNKPTIITYMILGGTPTEMKNSIQYFFSNIVTALPFNDIIGASFYSYSPMFDPLKMGKQSSILSDIDTAETFGGYCTNYITTSNNTPLLGIFAVFPNSSKTSCSFASNPYYLTTMTGQNSITSNLNSGRFLKLEKPAPKMFECASCKGVNSIKKYFVKDADKWLLVGSGIKYKEVQMLLATKINCSNYSDISMYAEMNGVPPLVAKAFAYTESGFNPCLASKIDITKSGCNYIKTTNRKKYVPTQVINPSALNAGCVNGITFLSNIQPKIDEKLCAYGMFQLIDLPGSVITNKKYAPYEKSLTSHKDQISRCVNRDVFNPFNESQSACVGTGIIAAYISRGTQAIQKKFGSLDKFAVLARLGEWVNTSKKTWVFIPNRQKVYHFIYYYAYHRYYGDAGVIDDNMDTIKAYLTYMKQNPPKQYGKKNTFRSFDFFCQPEGSNPRDAPPELTNICSQNDKFRKCMEEQSSEKYNIKSLKDYLSGEAMTINGKIDNKKSRLVPYQSYIFDIFHCIYNLNKKTESDYGWNFMGSYYGMLSVCGDKSMGCPPDGYLYDYIKNELKKQKTP